MPVTPEAAVDDELADLVAGRDGAMGRVAAVSAAPTTDVMRKDLEDKGILLEDSAQQDAELNHLTRLLNKNINIIATSKAELPGIDIMRHRIVTGNSPSLRKRAYRQSPQDMAEISPQTK